MGAITIEQGDRLYWLGRYIERAFTTMKSLENLYDRILDTDPEFYMQYLGYFGLSDVYDSRNEFIHSFIYDRDNSCSVMYSLERAYDNGIELRDEISTEALSYIQVAIDLLDGSVHSTVGMRASMLPIEDTLYGFWGCIYDNIYDDEIRNIIFCGKCVERLELYLRLRYRTEFIDSEFNRFCKALRRIPKNTPYRYNTKQLSVLVEIIQGGYKDRNEEALAALGRLFEAPRRAITV